MEGCIVQQDGSLEALVWQAEAQHRLPREAITALLAAPEAEENLAAAG